MSLSVVSLQRESRGGPGIIMRGGEGVGRNGLNGCMFEMQMNTAITMILMCMGRMI